jgi:hypothetical protein
MNLGYLVFAILMIVLLAIAYLSGRGNRLRLTGAMAGAYLPGYSPFAPLQERAYIRGNALGRPADFGVSLMSASVSHAGHDPMSAAGFFRPSDGEYVSESWLGDQLNALEQHELQQIFGSQFDGNIKVWVGNQVKSFLSSNDGGTITACKVWVDAQIPKLLASLTPLVPSFLQSYVPLLEIYAQSVVNNIIDSVYAQVVAAANKTAPAK